MYANTSSRSCLVIEASAEFLTLTPAILQNKMNCLLSMPSSFAIANMRKFKPDFQSSASRFDADI